MSGKYFIERIAAEGDYTIDDEVARITDQKGNSIPLSMTIDWPVKKSMPFYKRSVPTETMPTGVRIFEALFPIAYGGTACNPGPFGAGKTVIQHALARHSQADVVIVAACV